MLGSDMEPEDNTPVNRYHGISIDTFVLMQANILNNCSGSDRHADAYYEALQILKVTGVTSIDSVDIKRFK